MNSCAEGLDLTGFDPETPEYSFDREEIPVPKEGGDYMVNITSNLPWRAKTVTDWIILKNESGLGDGTFTFTASRNRTIDERIGEISVWVTNDDQKTIKIIQAPSEASDLVNHYYVKTTGTDANDGLSWAEPTTLSNALNIMAPGDHIHIAAGK
ncbi:MAG: BACON domain-containing protein [Prevotellaceae bacterium]|nr:BACON domain-containing protein [Prevotellaceae bacterium]